MAYVLDRLGAALLDASLAATAISGLVVLAMVQCRQPARRRVWARAGLVATLALLPLAALNPFPRFDLWRPLVAIVPATLDNPGPRPNPGVKDAEACPSPWSVGPTERSGWPPSGGPRRWGRWPRWAGRSVVVAYGACSSIGLSWLALGLWGSRRLVRRGTSPSLESLGHYASLPFDGPGSRPRLLVCDRARRPVILGLFRPVILIPTDFDRPESVGPLRLGLLHELAHAEARDHAFGPLSALTQTFWFFLPTIWWVRDQMRLDQEFLADRRAVAHFGTSGRYASSLVELASEPASANVGLDASMVSTGSSGVASALFQRVLMLLKCPFAMENRPPRWWRYSTASGVAVTTLVASCLTLRGLAGWPDMPAGPAVEPSRSFQLKQLTITQQGNGSEPFDLRVRLPKEFRLTLDVMAEPSELGLIEILGHRLRPFDVVDSPADPFWLWHRVEVRRSGGREEIRVDGQLLEPAGDPPKLAFWLTIRPLSSQPTRIRDLDLSW